MTQPRDPSVPPGPVQATLELVRSLIINRCQPGDGLPSQRALSRRFGVSRATVQQVLNRLVSQGWVSRKRGSHNYVVIRPVQAQPRTSAFITPLSVETMVWHPYCRDTTVGVHQQSRRYDRSALVISAEIRRMRDVHPSLFWTSSLRSVDSAVTLEVFDEDFLATLAELYPVVCIDAPCNRPGVSVAVADHRMSVRMAFKHLLDLGHRRIAYVGPTHSSDPSAKDRLTAYRDCFAWAGLSSDPAWIALFPSGANPEYDAELIRAIAALPPDRQPTAWIAVDYSLFVMLELMAAGISIPRQASLVCVGEPMLLVDLARSRPTSVPLSKRVVSFFRLAADVPLWGFGPEMLVIRQTHISLPFDEMGRWAVDELVRRLQSPSTADCATEIFPPTLIPGQTTAPAATS